MAHTFKGGIEIEKVSSSENRGIEKMDAPEYLYISFDKKSSDCEPIVQIGEKVNLGQILAQSPTCKEYRIHSGVSGTVTHISEYVDFESQTIRYITVQNDYQNTPDPSIQPFGKRLTDVSVEELIEKIADAGIYKMDGSHELLSHSLTKISGKVEELIVHICESDPYLISMQCLMKENPMAIVNGIKILMKAAKARHAIIAIFESDEIYATELCKIVEQSNLIDVKFLKNKYPQEKERILLETILKKTLPSDYQAEEIGCAVYNAFTAAVVFETFMTGKPQMERLLTVHGDCIEKEKCLMVPIGTSFLDVLDFCGGLKREPAYVIHGGVLNGESVWDIHAPVTKETSGVIVLSGDYDRKETISHCIRCGKCVAVCPVNLMPLYLAECVDRENWKRCGYLGINSCIECGTCTYVCEGQVPILQKIRIAKKNCKAVTIADGSETTDKVTYSSEHFEKKETDSEPSSIKQEHENTQEETQEKETKHGREEL